MFQFSYLPYFPTAIDKKINRIHIFNFATLKDQYIDNIQIRNRIQQLCEMYVDSNGEPSNQIAIAVIADKKFHSPDYVFGSILYSHSVDEKLFAALANLIDRRNPDDLHILKALDWVRLAFSNSACIVN